MKKELYITKKIPKRPTCRSTNKKAGHAINQHTGPK